MYGVVFYADELVAGAGRRGWGARPQRGGAVGTCVRNGGGVSGLRG